MRFDGNVYYHEREPHPEHKLLTEWADTAPALDQGGFTTCWLGEHHFWYSGYPVACPNPVLVSLQLASITENLRMGKSACILPGHHPIRLAEDLATADQLTGGRLDVGIARGINNSASIQFHHAADRRDPATNYWLFEETLDIMLKCWTESAFRHEGEFDTFPVPGRSEDAPHRLSGIRGRAHRQVPLRARLPARDAVAEPRTRSLREGLPRHRALRGTGHAAIWYGRFTRVSDISSEQRWESGPKLAMVCIKASRAVTRRTPAMERSTSWPWRRWFWPRAVPR